MDLTNIKARANLAAGVAKGDPAAITEANKLLASKMGMKEGNTRMGMVDGDISVDHKVILEYAVGAGSSLWIEAMMPPNFNLELRSNWSQKDAMGLKDAAGPVGGALGKAFGAASNMTNGKTSKVLGGLSKGAEVLGRVGGAVADYAGFGGVTAKMLTAHYWQGASPVSVNIPFEFIAQKDPEKEVIQPIKELYKLAAPYEENGIIIPPGPSVAGYLTGVGVKINVYVGSKIAFKNVVVESVSAEIDTRPAKGSGHILHAKVDVSFTSFFAVTRDDVDDIFFTGGS